MRTEEIERAGGSEGHRRTGTGGGIVVVTTTTGDIAMSITGERRMSSMLEDFVAISLLTTGAHRSSKHRETSTERRERKKAEKAARKAQQGDDAEQRAITAEMLMYSAEDNPFNDANLGSQFKWGKKEEKDKKMGMTPAEARARDERRRQEAAEEIARLNAKRAEREKEQAQREEEEARLARLQESAAMSEWVAKEDDFDLDQRKKRAVIRVRENRAKPIDLLALNLKWADPRGQWAGRERNAIEAEQDEEDEEAGLDIDLEEPYHIFDVSETLRTPATMKEC